jgi:general secretion pathway protein D
MKKIILLAGLALFVCSCATFNQSYKLGNSAEMNKNWDEAINLYEKAILAEPNNAVYRLALDRAKHAASLSFLQKARQLASQGKKEEALAAYDKSLLYDPLNTIIIQERGAMSGTPQAEETPPPEKIEPPIKLRVKEEKLVLNFPSEASLRSLFLTLARTGGVNILFDENFRDIPYSISLSDVGFEEALRSLCVATKNFYRIVDERSVIIVPDNPMKRLQYELNGIRSFRLSNVKAEEILPSLQQMLSSQFKAVKVFADKNLNVITVRDTPATIALAAKLIRLWDRPRAEVIIDLEMMEVSRNRLRQLGINFDQNMVGLSYGNPSSSASSTSTSDSTATSAWVNLPGLKLGQSGSYYVSLPIAYLNFLQTDSDTKIIAQPRLRGLSGEQIESMVGQKVPIPQTTFTPIAAGGVNQQPVTSYTYENIGINIKVKPNVHIEGAVTLELDLEITSLGGTGYANIPIITTRKVKNILRLKDGETNLLAGLLRDEERKSLKGIPGIHSLPIIGRLFDYENTTMEQTDVILTVTPYIIRKVPTTPEDSKPIWVDVEDSRGAGAGGEEGLDEEMVEEDAIPGRRPQFPGRDQAAAGPGQVVFSPGNFELPKGREFRMTVNVRSSDALGNLAMSISFNPQTMKMKDILPGAVLQQGGANAPFLKDINNSSGMCTIGFTSPNMTQGTTPSGPLAVLIFETLNSGESTITASSVTANTPQGKPLSFEVRAARVVVR